MSRVPYSDNVRGHRPIIRTDEDERPEGREGAYSQRNREDPGTSYNSSERSGQLNQRGHSQPSRYTPERGAGDYRQPQFVNPGYRGSGGQYPLGQSRERSYSQPRGHSQAGHNQRPYNQSRDQSNYDQTRDQTSYHQSRDQSNYQKPRDQSNYYKSQGQSSYQQSRGQSNYTQSQVQNDYGRNRDRNSYKQSTDQYRGDQSSDVFRYDQSSGQFRYNQSVDRNGYDRSSDQYRPNQSDQYRYNQASDRQRSSSGDRDRRASYDSSPDRQRSSSGGPYRDYPRRDPKPVYSPPYTFSSPSTYKPYETEREQHQTSRRESERGRSRFPKSSSQAYPPARNDQPCRDTSYHSSQTNSREREEVQYISDDSRDRSFQSRQGNSRDRDVSRDSSSDGSYHVRGKNSRERLESEALVEEVKREQHTQSRRDKSKKVSPGSSRNQTRNEEMPTTRLEGRNFTSSERESLRQNTSREHASSADEIDAMNLDSDSEINHTDIEQYVPYSRDVVEQPRAGHGRQEHVSGNSCVSSSTVDITSLLKGIQETVKDLTSKAALKADTASLQMDNGRKEKQKTNSKEKDHTHKRKDHTNKRKDHRDKQKDRANKQKDHDKQKDHANKQKDHDKQKDHTNKQNNHADTQNDRDKLKDHTNKQNNHADTQNDHTNKQNDHADTQNDRDKLKDHTNKQKDRADTQKDRDKQKDRADAQKDHDKQKDGADTQKDRYKQKDHTNKQKDNADKQKDHADVEKTPPEDEIDALLERSYALNDKKYIREKNANARFADGFQAFTRDNCSGRTEDTRDTQRNKHNSRKETEEQNNQGDGELSKPRSATYHSHFNKSRSGKYSDQSKKDEDNNETEIEKHKSQIEQENNKVSSNENTLGVKIKKYNSMDKEEKAPVSGDTTHTNTRTEDNNRKAPRHTLDSSKETEKQTNLSHCSKSRSEKCSDQSRKDKQSHEKKVEKNKSKMEQENNNVSSNENASGVKSKKHDSNTEKGKNVGKGQTEDAVLVSGDTIHTNEKDGEKPSRKKKEEKHKNRSDKVDNASGKEGEISKCEKESAKSNSATTKQSRGDKDSEKGKSKSSACEKIEDLQSGKMHKHSSKPGIDKHSSSKSGSKKDCCDIGEKKSSSESYKHSKGSKHENPDKEKGSKTCADQSNTHSSSSRKEKQEVSSSEKRAVERVKDIHKSTKESDHQHKNEKDKQKHNKSDTSKSNSSSMKNQHSGKDAGENKTSKSKDDKQSNKSRDEKHTSRSKERLNDSEIGQHRKSKKVDDEKNSKQDKSNTNKHKEVHDETGMNNKVNGEKMDTTMKGKDSLLSTNETSKHIAKGVETKKEGYHKKDKNRKDEERKHKNAEHKDKASHNEDKQTSASDKSKHKSVSKHRHDKGKHQAKKTDLKEHSSAVKVGKDHDLDAVHKEKAKSENKEQAEGLPENSNKRSSSERPEKHKPHKKTETNTHSHKKATDMIRGDKKDNKVNPGTSKDTASNPLKKDIITTDSSSDDMDTFLAKIDDVLETNKQSEDNMEAQSQTSLSNRTAVPEVPSTSKSENKLETLKFNNIKRLKERNGKLYWKSIHIKNPKVVVKRLDSKKSTLSIKVNSAKGKSLNGKKTADKFKRIRRVSSHSSTESDSSDVGRQVSVVRKKCPVIESDTTTEESAKQTDKHEEQEDDVSDNRMEESFQTENALPDKQSEPQKTHENTYRPETANGTCTTGKGKMMQSVDSKRTSKSDSSRVKRTGSVDSNCSIKSAPGTKSGTAVDKIHSRKSKDKDRGHTSIPSNVQRANSVDSNCSTRSESSVRNKEVNQVHTPSKVSRTNTVDSNCSTRSESCVRNDDQNQVQAPSKVSRTNSVDSNCSTRSESSVRNDGVSQVQAPSKVSRTNSVDSNCSTRSESSVRNDGVSQVQASRKVLRTNSVDSNCSTRSESSVRNDGVSRVQAPSKVLRTNSVDSNCSTRSESSLKHNKDENKTNALRKVSRTNSVDSNCTTRSEASLGNDELNQVKTPSKVSRSNSVDSNCTTRSEACFIAGDGPATSTNHESSKTLPEIDMENDKTETQESSLLFQTGSPEESHENKDTSFLTRSGTKVPGNKRLRRRHSVHGHTTTERRRKLRALTAYVEPEESGVEGDIEDNDITMITLNLDDHNSNSEDEYYEQKNKNDTEEQTQIYSDSLVQKYVSDSSHETSVLAKGTDRSKETVVANKPVLQENGSTLKKENFGIAVKDPAVKAEKEDESGHIEKAHNIVDIEGTDKTPQPRITDVQPGSPIDESSVSSKKSDGLVTKDNCEPEIKKEPAWSLRGYTQEPDVILLSDDDEIIMSFSQPVINLDTDSEEEITDLSGKVKVKQETSDWSDDGSCRSSGSDIKFIDLGFDISSGQESDMGSDYFDPEDMFGSELLGKADQYTVSSEKPVVKPAEAEDHNKVETETTSKSEAPADSDFSSSGDEIMINTAFDSQMTQPMNTKHSVGEQKNETKADPYDVATQLPSTESHKSSSKRKDNQSKQKHVSFVPDDRNIKTEDKDPYMQATQIDISSDSDSEIDALDYKSEHISSLKQSDDQARVYEAETQIPDDKSNQHDNLDDETNELYQMQTQAAEQVSDLEKDEEVTIAEVSDVSDSYEDPQMKFYNGTNQIQQSGADRLGIKMDYSFEEAAMLDNVKQSKWLVKSDKSDKTSPRNVRFSDEPGTDDNEPWNQGFDYTAQTQANRDHYESSDDAYGAATQYVDQEETAEPHNSNSDLHDSFYGAATQVGTTSYNDQTLVDEGPKVEGLGEESDLDSSLYAAVTKVEKSIYTSETQIDLTTGDDDDQMDSSDDALYAAQTLVDVPAGIEHDQQDDSDDALYAAQTQMMTSNQNSDDEETDDRYDVQTQIDHTVESTDEDPYIAATQVSETPQNKHQHDHEQKKADVLKSNRLKRPIQHTDSGGFQVPACPMPAKKARTAIEIQPQRQKSITEKRNTGILIKPAPVVTAEKAATNVPLDEDAPRLPPPRSDIFVQNASKKDMWLSKEVGSSNKTSATTPGKSRKRRRTKSKEDPGALLSAQMKEAKARLKERNFQSIVNPDAIADPAKRPKPAATVTAPDDLEDADFPTCSQIVRQGLPILNETPMLLKKHAANPPQTGRFASRSEALTEVMLTSSSRPVKTSSVSVVTSTTTVSMATVSPAVTYSSSLTRPQVCPSTSTSDSSRTLEKQLSTRDKQSSGSNVSKDKDKRNSGSSKDKHPHVSSLSKDKLSSSSSKGQDSGSSRDKRSASKEKHSDKPSSSKERHSGLSNLHAAVPGQSSSKDKHSSNHSSSKESVHSVSSSKDKRSDKSSSKDSAYIDSSKDKHASSSKDKHSSGSASNKESEYKPLSLLDVELLTSLSTKDKQPNSSKGKQPASSHSSSKSKHSSSSASSGSSASRDKQPSSASSSPKDSFQRESRTDRDRRPSGSSSSKVKPSSASSSPKETLQRESSGRKKDPSDSSLSKDKRAVRFGSSSSRDRPLIESTSSKDANPVKFRTSKSSDSSAVLKPSDSSKHRTTSTPVSSNPAVQGTFVHTAPALNKQPSTSGASHRQPPSRTSPLYDDKRPRDANSNMKRTEAASRPNLMLKPGYCEPTVGPSSAGAMSGQQPLYGGNVWPSSSTGRVGLSATSPSYHPTVPTHQVPAHPLSRDLRPPAQGRSPGVSGGQPPTWSPLVGAQPPPAVGRGAPQMREAECMNWSRFLSVILKWSPKWLEEKAAMSEPPPVTVDLQGPKEVTLWPLVEWYQSYREYCETFMLPLLLHETWESCYKDWKEKKERYSQKLLCNQQKPSGDRTLELKLAGLMSKSERRTGSGFKEGDLVKVHLTRAKMAPVMPDKTELVMGYVEKVETQDHRVDRLCQSRPEFVALRKPDSVVITLTLKIRKRDWFPSQDHLIELKEVGSIVTTRRQWCALYALTRSPLCSDLLRPEGATTQTYGDRAPSSICQLQTQFNPSQSQAINTAAKIVALPKEVGRICLLQGPPGTGKSHTIIGIIESILKIKGRKGCICLCAPSNAAVDELLRRLHQLRRDKRRCVNFVRLGKKSGMHPDIQQYSVEALAEKNIRKVKQAERLKRLPASVQIEIQTLTAKVQDQKDKIEQTTDTYQKQRLRNDLKKLLKNVDDIERKCNLDKSNLFTDPRLERDTKRNVLLKADVIAGTLSSFGSSQIRNFQQNFDCVIIDEATQAIELDTLIPLQYGTSKLIMVGDPEQLSPTVISQVAKDNKLWLSLFERLHGYFSRVYASDPTQNPVILLDTQYRMNPEISQFPSTYIYEGRLKDDPSVERRATCELEPYILYDIQEGQEQFSQTTSSMSNLAEAYFVAELCHFIVKKTWMTERVIGIITTYAKQRKTIETELQRKGLRHVEVSTVDGFQGQERHVIILSCVRANDTGAVGFVGNRNRMNVALTRAKYAMYLVGHLDVLENNDEWKPLLANARERKKIVEVTERISWQAIQSCLKKTS